MSTSAVVRFTINENSHVAGRVLPLRPIALTTSLEARGHKFINSH